MCVAYGTWVMRRYIRQLYFNVVNLDLTICVCAFEAGIIILLIQVHVKELIIILVRFSKALLRPEKNARSKRQKEN